MDNIFGSAEAHSTCTRDFLGTNSGEIFCLVAFDGQFVPGHDAETIKRIGRGKFASLRTELRLRIGLNTLSAMVITFTCRNINVLYFLDSIQIPLDKACDSVAIETIKISLEDDSIMNTLDAG